MGFIATGVPNLDTILGGGLPEAYLVVISGGPGAGKTVLVQQIASHFARHGGRVLYVTALSEPHSSLVAHLSGFTFFDRSLLGDRIKIVNVFPIARQGLGAVTSTIVRTIKDDKISLLIFDNFRSLRDIHADEREVRAFSYELAGTLSSIQTSALFTSEFEMARAEDAPEVVIADGMIHLSSEWTGLRVRRTIEIVKLRGAGVLRGPHSFQISRAGIAVFPRPESAYTLPVGAPLKGKAALGVPWLDDMLHGGLPLGSSTLVVGHPGAGKTALNLHFAASGLRAGEPVVFVTITEAPEHLVAKAGRIGLDVREAFDGGLLKFLHYPITELDPDRLSWHIWSEVESLQARRVVIDGFTLLERAVGSERLPGFLTALFSHLRANNVTVSVARSSNSAGSTLPSLGGLPVATIVDNIILLRTLEREGRLRRTAVVLKVRDGPHDHAVKEYTISASGLQLEVG